MLKVKELSLDRREYGRKTPEEDFRLEKVSFELGDGYIMALLGENGAGKTTLLDLLSGNAAKGSGSIIYDGVELNAGTRAKINSEMAYVGPQGWCLENETVNTNISLLSVLYEQFDMELLEKTLKQFDFPDSCHEKKYQELSTGQKMQFSIAFALACKPKIMLLDEPFANLDPVIRVDIADILQTSVRRDGMSIIVSTHEVNEIDDMVDYVGIMKKGRMTGFGSREEVKTEWL